MALVDNQSIMPVTHLNNFYHLTWY